MAKTKISEFSSTPSNNTDIDSINIAEGCAPSGINDAIRELMAQLKDFQTGAQGDSFNGPIGSSTAGTGAFTTISATGAITSTLATGSAPFVIASTTKVANLNVDLLDGADWASPAALGSTTPAAGSFTTLGASSTATLNTLVSSGATLTGGTINGMTIGATTASTGAFTTLAASSSVTLSGGTANGVTYLNGSKVLTSGSALTFDGTTVVTTTGASSFVAKYPGGIQQMAIGSDGSSGAYAGTLDNYDVRFLRNSAEQMRLTSTGLGIGTSSPSQKLEVNGSILAGNYYGPQTAFNFGTSDFSASIVGYGTTGVGLGTSALSFRTAGTERMFLNSAGNLGLGVTPSAWSAITAMQVKGAALGSTGNEMYLYANAYYAAGTAWTYKNSAAAFGYEQNGGHKWFTAASGTAGTNISFTQAMTLDASGNLGVGTTSPVFRADVISNTTYQLRLATASNQNYVNGGIYLGAYGTSDPYYYGYMRWDQSDINLKIGSQHGNSSGGIVFLTGVGSGAQTERARITYDGNFLVGTTNTNPAGNNSSGLAIQNGGLMSVSRDGNACAFLNRSSSDGEVLRWYRQGTTVGNVSVTTTATSYNTSSDYRLKNSIAPMTGALAKVALLKPCTYKWNADGSDGEGFIAHELAEVCPHAVTGEKDAVDEEGNPKYQGIDTSFLVATLTAALQEAVAKITALEARLDAANL